MQPKFFENHSGKFFLAMCVAMALLAMLFNGSVHAAVLRWVGLDILSNTVVTLLAFIGFVIAMTLTRTEGEFNYQMAERARAAKRNYR